MRRNFKTRLCALAANHNPLMDHKFGADPYAMTYNGRVYIYMTNDSQQFDQTTKNWQGHPNAENNYSKISTITVISSDDMVNWVDHGEIDVAGITSWAKNSWAPAAALLPVVLRPQTVLPGSLIRQFS